MEMQDFVEDFFFTAAAIEVQRYQQVFIIIIIFYFILFFKDFSLLPPLSRSSATSRCLLLLYLHIYRAYRPRAKRRNKAFMFYVFVYLSHLHIYTGPTADEQRGATKPSQGAASAGCRARHVHALP
jgi:hypothetical protein